MRIPGLLAAAAALLVLLLAVAGAAAQEAAAVDVRPEEIAAKARAKEEAVLAAELGQLRAKVSALGASVLLRSIRFGGGWVWLVGISDAASSGFVGVC